MGQDFKEIKLTKGLVALVDSADFPYLSQFKWKAIKMGNTWYARRGIKAGGKWTKIFMHRDLLKPPRDMAIDHINSSGLDNRRSNLRICTFSENLLNTAKYKNNKSGYKGVVWFKSVQKWWANINFKKKQYSLGYFDSLEEAAKAYDKGALKYHGAYARLNFPEV